MKVGNIEIVNVGDFVTISDDSMKEHGIEEGNLIYLAGDVLARVNEEDPYLLRQTFVAALCDQETGELLIEKGAFTVDGMRLVGVSAEEQTEYEELRDSRFTPEEQPEDETTD